MRCDHQSATHERDPHFPGMRGKLISKPCCARDAAQPCSHQQDHAGSTVFAEARKKRYCSETCHQNSQAAVSPLFRWKQVRHHCGQGKKKRCQEAMNNAKGRGPNTKAVGPNTSSVEECLSQGRHITHTNSKSFSISSQPDNLSMRLASSSCFIDLTSK